MDTNQGYKNRALASLSGKWDKAIIATIIYLIITIGVSQVITIPFSSSIAGSGSASFLWTVLCFPLLWGYTVFFLNIIREKKIDWDSIFDGYKNGEWKRIGGTYLLYYIYVILWTLLLIIPGIIKALSYSMTPFILQDDPTISGNAAIEKSMRMMDGHKMDLFWLFLSFIGWIILSIMTFGIGFILLEPYINTSVAHFYEDLKEQQGE
jgi:uncharacterized membrane protein